MRILQVIHQFPRVNRAGSENYTMQITKQLSIKHDVAVITMGPEMFDGPFGYLEPRPGYPFPVFAFFRHPENSNLPEKEYWNPGLDVEFNNFLHQWKPDIVHFQHALKLSISLINTTAKAGIPVLFTAHDYWTICPNIVLLNQKSRPCQHLTDTGHCRLCMSFQYIAPRIAINGRNLYSKRRQRILNALQLCKHVLCPSKTLMTQLTQAGFDQSNLKLWQFGIDTDFTSDKKQPDSPVNHPIRFGYTGTLAKQKGVDVLLEAFFHLPVDLRNKAELRIYGNPNSSMQTKKRVNSWKKKFKHSSINFCGPYNRDQLADIHRNLDVVLVPSVWYENRPLTILESFVSGNPVIGSDLGGVGELVGDTRAGWTFPPEDRDALTNILVELIKSPALISEKRNYIPRVPDISDEINNLEMLYRNLVLSP